MVEETEKIAILLKLENEAFERRAKSSARAISRLEARYDPLAKAANRLEIEQAQLNRALEKGTIDAAKHAKIMAQVQAQYNRSATGTKTARNNVVAMNSAVAAQTGFLARNRFAFQQGGYQVQDFAVQVQGGTSAVTAMTQQGSQLLGIFGPMGAVMGAVLAVGLPLAAVLFNLGDAEEDAKDKAKKFAEKLKELESAMSSASAAAALAGTGGLNDLGEKFGEITDDVRELAVELHKIEERAAKAKISIVLDDTRSAVSTAIEALSGEYAVELSLAGTEEAIQKAEKLRGLVEKIEAAQSRTRVSGGLVSESDLAFLQSLREKLAALEGDFANLGALTKSIALPTELLSQLSQAQSALDSAQAASDFKGVAEQLTIVRDLLVQSGVVINQEVLDAIVLAEKQARLMANTLDEGKAAAEGIAKIDLASTIGAGASEAARLAQNLGISFATAQRLAAMGPQGLPSVANGGRGGDPREHGGSFTDWQNQDADQFLENWKPPKISRGGGGGGGGSRGRESKSIFAVAEDELQKLERQVELLGKSKTEVAVLTLKFKMLDAAKKQGLVITEELTAQIEAEANEVAGLATEYDIARDKILAMETIQQNFKDSVIDAAMGGADAMETFRKSIKRAALEYLLFGDGLFAGGKKNSGGGILGSIFGSIFGSANGNVFSSGSHVKAYANGGVVSGPTMFPMKGAQTGLMGEAGPEAIMPLARIGGKLGVRAISGDSQPKVIYVPQPYLVGVEADDNGRLIGRIKAVENMAGQASAEFGPRVISTIIRAQKDNILK